MLQKSNYMWIYIKAVMFTKKMDALQIRLTVAIDDCHEVKNLVQVKPS